MTEKSLHEDKSETEWKHTVVETKNKGIVIRRGGGQCMLKMIGKRRNFYFNKNRSEQTQTYFYFNQIKSYANFFLFNESMNYTFICVGGSWASARLP